MGYAFQHGNTAYTPDGGRMPGADAEAHNAALEAAELAEWAKAPERFAGYISETPEPQGVSINERHLTTWRGTKLGKVTSFRLLRAGYGAGHGYRMAAVRVRGTNGAEYYGRYGYDSGQLVRLKKVKG